MFFFGETLIKTVQFYRHFPLKTSVAEHHLVLKVIFFFFFFIFLTKHPRRIACSSCLCCAIHSQCEMRFNKMWMPPPWIVICFCFKDISMWLQACINDSWHALEKCTLRHWKEIRFIGFPYKNTAICCLLRPLHTWLTIWLSPRSLCRSVGCVTPSQQKPRGVVEDNRGHLLSVCFLWCPATKLCRQSTHRYPCAPCCAWGPGLTEAPL